MHVGNIVHSVLVGIWHSCSNSWHNAKYQTPFLTSHAVLGGLEPSPRHESPSAAFKWVSILHSCLGQSVSRDAFQLVAFFCSNAVAVISLLKAIAKMWKALPCKRRWGLLLPSEHSMLYDPFQTRAETVWYEALFESWMQGRPRNVWSILQQWYMGPMRLHPDFGSVYRPVF